MFEELSKKNMTSARQIPTLPEQVKFDDVKNKMKGLKRLPIGIEKGTLNVKSFDLTAEVGKLILTMKLKYAKALVKSIVEEIISLQDNLVFLDPSEMYLDLEGRIVNYFTSDFDKKIEKVMDFAEKQEQSEDPKETVIIINSIGKLLTKLESTSKVSEMFDKFKTMKKTHVIIVDEVAKIKDSSYESWFARIDGSEGLYIGTGIDGQNILKVTQYNKELQQQLPKNFGYYIKEGNYHIVKLLEFERVVEDDEDEE